MKVARESGVTTVVAGPGDSNLIGGTFVAFKTYGNTVEKMVIEDEIAFKVSLGNSPKQSYGNRDTIIASVMEKNGLDFCISTGHPTVDISMTMVQTIMMHKKGLSRKTALEAIAINAANMVGLGDRIGSIEVGKDADIVIWDGEPLDYYTSPRMVIIDGKIKYSN